MNARSRTALAAFALLLSAPYARASIPTTTLYDISKESVDKAALERIAKVDKACTVSMMSRIGPTPQQRAQCDAAVVAALETPREIAHAALYYLDQHSPQIMFNSWRIYDVVGRSQQLDLAEKLVVALERIEAGSVAQQRTHERAAIASTLQRLTFAEPKGTPAIAWREWLTQHKHETRPQLLAAHVVRLRGILANPATDESTLLLTLEFLANEPTTRDEGLRAIADQDMRKRLQPHYVDRLDRLAKALTAAPQKSNGKPTPSTTASLTPRG